jgi:hypothetical protein
LVYSLENHDNTQVNEYFQQQFKKNKWKMRQITSKLSFSVIHPLVKKEIPFSIEERYTSQDPLVNGEISANADWSM